MSENVNPPKYFAVLENLGRNYKEYKRLHLVNYFEKENIQYFKRRLTFVTYVTLDSKLAISVLYMKT